MTHKPVPVLFLDIDGTVRHGKTELGRFVNHPADVRVFPEAVTMMRRWRAAGGRIVGVSNQGGIALGLANRDQVAEAMLETDRQTGNLFAIMRICPHHPDAGAHCWCRKPQPGMLIDSIRELSRRPVEHHPSNLALMVGDRPEDQQCAQAAGIAFLDAAEWRAQAAQPEMRYLVAGHVVGNETSGYGTTWATDGEHRPTVAAAAAHGWHLHGHDDWLIAEVHGDQLIGLWEGEDRPHDDPPKLPKIAAALGIKVGCRCDTHGSHCEPPADLCCAGCTEAAHPHHPDGVAYTWATDADLQHAQAVARLTGKQGRSR